jgi:hypothetical protein
MQLRLWRRVRLRAIDETTAYARCHGDRSSQILAVRVVKPPPGAKPQPAASIPRGRGRVSGEQLRQRFEQLLDARETR